jgi:hypothetical protein
VLFGVFATSGEALPAEAVAEQCQRLAPQLRCAFHGDDRGWHRVEFLAPDGAEPAELDQYWATEDGIRQELNLWAAWLERFESNPHSAPLMLRVIQAAQMFCLNAAAPDGVWLELCRWLAWRTDGVYQVDGSGIFAADGTLLVAEAT